MENQKLIGFLSLLHCCELVIGKSKYGYVSSFTIPISKDGGIKKEGVKIALEEIGLHFSDIEDGFIIEGMAQCKAFKDALQPIAKLILRDYFMVDIFNSTGFAAIKHSLKGYRNEDLVRIRRALNLLDIHFTMTDDILIILAEEKLKMSMKIMDESKPIFVKL